MIKPTAAALMLSLALAGCQFVPLTAGGEKARVLSVREVRQCQKIGITTAAVEDEIIGIPRQKTVIAEELTRLARNNAAIMGGDTVVPASEIVRGTQSFTIYKCVPGS